MNKRISRRDYPITVESIMAAAELRAELQTSAFYDHFQNDDEDEDDE